MGQITVELNRSVTRKNRNGSSYTIPSGTKFIVDEEELKERQSTNSFIEVVFNRKADGVRSTYLDKVTTPLEFATKEETVNIRVIKNTATSLKLGDIYTIPKREWNSNSNIVYITDTWRMFKEYFELIIPLKFDTKTKTRDDIYNKSTIELQQPLQFTGVSISPYTKFNIDTKSWKDKNNGIWIEYQKKKYYVIKEYFRFVHAFHEEVGTFPTIPVITGIDKDEPIYGKIQVCGTEGEDQPKTNSHWWLNENGFVYSPQDYYNIMYNSPSINQPSKRDKTLQDNVNEISKWYNSPIINESSNIFPTENLKDRIDEIKYGKGIKEQLEEAKKKQVYYGINTLKK